MRSQFTILAVAAALLVFPSAGFADPPTADDEQLYATTVTTMRGLPEPPYLTFVATVTARDLLDVELKDDHGIGRVLAYGARGRLSESWATSYRASDHTASIVDKPLSHLLSRSPLFNPTWTGVYGWFRYGISGQPFSPKSTPQPSPESDANLEVVASTRALSLDSYHIAAANPALCPGGGQGRHLHLTPRGDIKLNPLTDVTIDLASTRFCSLRFLTPLFGATGSSELHFATVNGYWMTTSNDADVHMFGLGDPHAQLHFTYDEMRFPDTLDDAIFALAKPK